MSIETSVIILAITLAITLITALIYQFSYSRSVVVYYMDIKKVSDLQSMVDLIKSKHGDCNIEYIRGDNNFMRIDVKKSINKE